MYVCVYIYVYSLFVTVLNRINRGCRRAFFYNDFTCAEPLRIQSSIPPFSQIPRILTPLLATVHALEALEAAPGLPTYVHATYSNPLLLIQSAIPPSSQIPRILTPLLATLSPHGVWCCSRVFVCVTCFSPHIRPCGRFQHSNHITNTILHSSLLADPQHPHTATRHPLPT